MDSKEFGLVAAQQLFKIENIHYGFWDNNRSASLSNWKAAQDRHSEFLFEVIKKALENISKPRLLDIGCGVGLTTRKLLDKGYNVDGLVPSNWMAKYAKKLINERPPIQGGNIFETTLENFKVEEKNYDLAFFSESYQYVDIDQSFEKLQTLLSPDGKVIIFDFFSRDNVPGKSVMGGGHSMETFYKKAHAHGFDILKDLDVTQNLSPNLRLINEILCERLLPFCNTLDLFLRHRYPKSYRLFRFLFKKRLAKLKFKYSQNRNEDNFTKHKVYRLILLQKR